MPERSTSIGRVAAVAGAVAALGCGRTAPSLASVASRPDAPGETQPMAGGTGGVTGMTRGGEGAAALAGAGSDESPDDNARLVRLDWEIEAEPPVFGRDFCVGVGGSGASGAAGTWGGGDRAVEDCGLLIDDMEDGTGTICHDGVRSGSWYVFNDGTTQQWPAVTEAPTQSSEIPGGRGSSRRAMRTCGGPVAEDDWGGGLGVELVAGDEYDGSAYDGITFWGRGMYGQSALVRLDDDPTSCPIGYKGACTTVPNADDTRRIVLTEEWGRFWIPFASLVDGYPPFDVTAMTSIQFLVTSGSSFDLWIDDLEFYVGEPECCDWLPEDCRGAIEFADPNLASALGAPDCIEVCTQTAIILPGVWSRESISSLLGVHCYANLVHLGVSGQDLTALDDLGGLNQLTTVLADGNQLVSLAGLTGLDGLRILDVSRNDLVDLIPLGAIAGLRVLRSAQNSLTSCNGLEPHSELQGLDLSDNSIKDIEPLARKPRLRTLNLANNAIVSIDALAAAAELEAVDLSDNAIVSIDALAGKLRLRTLDLAGNSVASVESLGTSPSLVVADFSDNRITSVSGVANTRSLLYLSFAGNQLREVTDLTNLIQLERLDLERNRIADITGLTGLTSLLVLDLSSNQLTSVSALSSLTALVAVDLSNNAITDLSPLFGLESLDRLLASDNAIRSIAGIEALRLSELHLAGNQIDDITALESIGDIKQLDLSNNPIHDLEPLATMGNCLEKLNLRHTAITTIAPLVRNENLRVFVVGQGAYVPNIDITDNPQLDCDAEADNIAALRERYLIVETDCAGS